jgi:hypothetical protein
MRALKFFFAASVFATYFAGMIILSAVTTRIVHHAMYPRPAVPAFIGQN